MPFNDGMPSTEFLSTTVSGTNGQFTTLTGTEDIVTAEIANAAVTSAKIGSGAVMTVNLSGGQVTTATIASEAVTVPKQAFVGTGSPAVWGNGIQFGIGTLSSASGAWVVFTPAFKAVPSLICTSKNDSAINIIGAGSGTNQGAGSIFVIGTTASTTFNWIACGSM